MVPLRFTSGFSFLLSCLGLRRERFCLKKFYMLSPIRLSIVLLASCFAGMIGIRWADPASPEPSTTAGSRTLPAGQPVVDLSPAAISERINTVFNAKGDGIARGHAAYSALLKLTPDDFLAAAQDMPALVARFNALPHDARSALLEAWFDRWLEVDSPGALRFLAASRSLDQLPKEGLGDQIRLGTVFGALARRQPDWVKGYLLARPYDPANGWALSALLKETALRDPTKAKQFLALFSNGESRGSALEGYVWGTSKAGNRAGFDLALAEPMGVDRGSLLGSAIDRMGDRGSATVRGLLDQIDDPSWRRALAMGAMESVSYHTREDLFSWIKEETARPRGMDKRENSAWAGTIVNATWNSGVPPASVADWAASLENDPEREVFGRTAERWADTNQGEFCAWLNRNATTLDAKAVERLSGALKSITLRDPAAARAWTDALPAGPLREQAQFEMVLSSAAQDNFAQVTAMYEGMASRDPSGTLANKVATLIVRKDGAQAAEWVMQRPAGPIRSELIALVAREWSERDPQAAAGWIEQITPGQERDEAICEYSAKAVIADPFTAAEWVQQITNPAIRMKAADRVFGIWNLEDPVAVRTWVRGLPGVDEAWRTKRLKSNQSI